MLVLGMVVVLLVFWVSERDWITTYLQAAHSWRSRVIGIVVRTDHIGGCLVESTQLCRFRYFNASLLFASSCLPSPSRARRRLRSGTPPALDVPRRTTRSRTRRSITVSRHPTDAPVRYDGARCRTLGRTQKSGERTSGNMIRRQLPCGATLRGSSRLWIGWTRTTLSSYDRPARYPDGSAGTMLDRSIL